MRAASLGVLLLPLGVLAVFSGVSAAAPAAGGTATDDTDAPGKPLTAPEEGEVPTGKFDFPVIGLRENMGDLGDDYGFGFLWGIGAGYQPWSPGRAFSFGLVWSTLWGRFSADHSTTADDPLRLLEMSFGVRLRRQLGESPRFLFLSTGATVLRANVPIPPQKDRLYLGGYAGLGLEQYIFGRMFIGGEARYGLFGSSAPASMSFLLSVSWGT